MHLRTIACTLLLIALAAFAPARGADRTVIQFATVTKEVEAWCLPAGFLYAPSFLPSTAKPSSDFEAVLLSPPQAVIATNAGNVAMDECTSLGSVTQAWKQGAHNVAIVAVTGIEPVYSLIGQKGLKRLDELKGKTLGSNGIATTATQAVIAILQKGANLMPDRDYTFVSAATGSARVAALIAGKIDGISSYPPYSYELADEGFPILAGERQYVPNYVQGVLAVNRDWAQQHRAELVGVLRTMLQAAKWLKDPSKKDEIIAKLADGMNMAGNKIGSDYARRIYADVIAVNGGVVDGLYGDRALFVSTLNLFAERGMIEKADFPPLDKVVDYSYLSEARRQLGMPAVSNLAP